MVFSARWGDASKFAVIKSFRTNFLPLTPFTANTLTDHGSFDAFIGRVFSASHTGGTAVDLSGDNASMRAAMGPSLFSDVRRSSTSALGGGTVTLDSVPFAQSLRKGNRVNPAALTEEVIIDPDPLFYKCDTANGEHPIVLAHNEGIIIRNRTVWPAAGTGILKIEMVWAEVVAY